MAKPRKSPQDYVSGRPTTDTPAPTPTLKPNTVMVNPNGTATFVDKSGKAITLTQQEQSRRAAINMGSTGFTAEEAARVGATPYRDLNPQQQLEAKAIEQAKFEAAKNEVYGQIQDEKLQQAIAEKQGAINEIGVLTPEQQALAQQGVEGQFENPYETLAAGTAAAGGIVGGIGTGLGAAGLATKLGLMGSAFGPAGIAIGAAAGAAGGVASYYGAVKIQKHGDVKLAKEIGNGAFRNMIWGINQANQGKLNLVVAEEFWDNQEANLEASLMGLKKLTDTNKDKFLSGGADDYAKMLALTERLPQLRADYKNAILNPNPNSVITEADIKAIMGE